jgi:RNA polymerase sigma-70 factor, ECF subfamily
MTSLPASLACVTTDADERAWVARIALGDQAAFERLVRRYYEPLHSFIVTIVGRGDIGEELLQDLLFRLWQSRATWNIHSSVRSYLYVAARNAALAHCRHERLVDRWRIFAIERGEGFGMGRGPHSTEVTAHALALREVIARALNRLPERCRLCAVLRLQHELSYTETAEIMGISVKAVEGLYTRALKTLRRALAAYE